MPSKRKRLSKVEEIADRQEMFDKLERRNGRVYLVDLREVLAPVEVRDEETEGWGKFQRNTQAMTTASEINRAYWAIWHYPWLTDEGRAARIQLLRARWRQLFAESNFVVD